MVEDDPNMSEVVCRYLTQFGYTPIPAISSEETMKHIDEVALVILDLQLPGEDGLEILRKIRQVGDKPVLIASARGKGTERIIGLEMGADDYVTKPFLPRELIARVKALLRRATPTVAVDDARSDTLSLDTKGRQVRYKDRDVRLSPQQFTLLQTLLSEPGRTFSREELLSSVWGEEGDTRRVDIMVSKVRTKLVDGGIPLEISSVWGVGYQYVGLNG